MLAILAESALRSLLLGGIVWIGLNLLRVRNPHVHMTSWLIVLVASLSMPLLMQWATVTVTVDALPVSVPDKLWLANHPLNNPPAAEPLGVPFPLQPDISVAPHTDSHAAINWLVVVTAFYACVAGLLVLRLAVGLCLTWRIARAATPIREPWTADWRVRISDAVGGPVTFGSTILLPPHYVDWDLQKRRAVLAHEGAHVVNRDFHVLLLASLNRAVFWFSPFAWWQLTRLAELAEIISDASALEVLEDRLSYAEIFCSISRGGRGRRRPGSRWPGRARSARVSSGFSRRPQTLRSPAGAGEFGRPQPFCRLSRFPQAALPTPRRLRRRSTARQMRRRRCASRSWLRSIHWAGPRSLPSPGKATSSLGNSAGNAKSGWLRRAAGPIPHPQPTAR